MKIISISSYLFATRYIRIFTKKNVLRRIQENNKDLDGWHCLFAKQIVGNGKFNHAWLVIQNIIGFNGSTGKNMVLNQLRNFTNPNLMKDEKS